MTFKPAAIPVDRIPVTLLTGFLGAGKTTLLNHLMKQPDMAGAAVLINEFGEVGIDHHLVEKVDETLMILDSGCVCCSMQGDLVQALKDLSARASKREIPPVTRVLIETTGLADPVPVIYTLMEHPFVAARYVCDGVVTVVDVTHGLQQLGQHAEAVRQVAMADRLLITKCDLTNADTRLALEQRLLALNPGATLTQVRNGVVSADMVFGAGIYTTRGKLPDVAAWMGEEAAREQRAREVRAQAPIAWNKQGFRLDQVKDAQTQTTDRHDTSVRSFVVEFDVPVKWYGFAAAMGRILLTHGTRLLRVKGLIAVDGSEAQPIVVHCVQSVAYPFLRLPAWPDQSPFQDKRGRLVFIVRDMSDEIIDSIRHQLAHLPPNVAAARTVATTPLMPTKCWLSQPMPSAGSSAIKHDGWVVQTPRLARR